MGHDVSPEDIADYRSRARRAGRETSHLSDHQIAQQIRIQRRGLYAPSKSELEEIRARAKRTAGLFRKSNDGVLKLLKGASRQLGSLELRRRGSPAHLSSVQVGKVAKEILRLRRSLLAYAPSMLSPEIRSILEAVDSWASAANRFLEEGTKKAEALISSIPGELSSLLEALRKKKEK